MYNIMSQNLLIFLQHTSINMHVIKKNIQVTDFLWRGKSEWDINYVLFPLIKN